jgi:hypothetical protein
MQSSVNSKALSWLRIRTLGQMEYPETPGRACPPCLQDPNHRSQARWDLANKGARPVHFMSCSKWKQRIPPDKRDARHGRYCGRRFMGDSRFMEGAWCHLAQMQVGTDLQTSHQASLCQGDQGITQLALLFCLALIMEAVCAPSGHGAMRSHRPGTCWTHLTAGTLTLASQRGLFAFGSQCHELNQVTTVG